MAEHDIVDAQGTVVADSAVPITFTVTGPGKIVGDNPALASAGTAAVLLQAGQQTGSIVIHASAQGLPSAELTITSK